MEVGFLVNYALRVVHVTTVEHLCPGATYSSRFPCCLDIEIPPTRAFMSQSCERKRLINQWVCGYLLCTFRIMFHEKRDFNVKYNFLVIYF